MAKYKDRFNQYLSKTPAGFLVGADLNQQQNELIKNRPQYQVQDQYQENQALASARAFGADRDAQMARENVDQQVASTVGQAKQISSSTGSILDTLRAVNEGGFNAKRGITQDEVANRGARMGELYGANAGLAEERDKAWNYNVNMPYQMKIQQIRERRKFRQEMLMKGLDLAGTIASGGVYQGGGGGDDSAAVMAGSGAGMDIGFGGGSGPAYEFGSYNSNIPQQDVFGVGYGARR